MIDQDFGHKSARWVSTRSDFMSGRFYVINNSDTVERLTNLIAKVQELTRHGSLHWERQINSAHRYARWNGNLLILGPSQSPEDSNVPRYLFITPFNSPSFIEINSNDEILGKAVLGLVSTVEEASTKEPPTDPFAIPGDILDSLDS